jgi:hypothetical protein
VKYRRSGFRLAQRHGVSITRERERERERESSAWTVSNYLIKEDTSSVAGFYENCDELSCSYELGNFLTI